MSATAPPGQTGTRESHEKIITTALVAATAAAALSACNMDTSSNAAGKAGHHAANSKAKTPNYTVAQENAIESAQSYLDMSGFSRAGLIGQLTSKAGEGYKMPDAVFAGNHIKVDWNKEAAESAKSYLDMSGLQPGWAHRPTHLQSRRGLHARAGQVRRQPRRALTQPGPS